MKRSSPLGPWRPLGPFLLMLALLLCAVPALAETGIQGRVAWRGELVEGVRVHAYRAIADIAAGRTVAVSAPVDVDGSYRLELPPGDYYLVARDFEGTAKPGDHFCYYSGAPVRVTQGILTNVGFNLIRIGEQTPPVQGAQSGIEGEIRFEDELLERAYLYVYTDPAKGFKGPGYLIQPVEKGRFRLRLPPGDYWILARKRAQGGQFGPIEIGDYFNYYHGNPVRIAAGEMHQVRIETITRLALLEEGEKAAFRGLRGQVVGPEGQALAGVRVFAYRSAEMTGHPDAFSPATDETGRFELALSHPGPWHLLARQSFGGPAQEGEWYGRLEGAGLTLNDEEPVREVRIRVEPKAP
ncbi:carboxypeptidase-like regulatory domain-containing protein [Geoalkalibacter sp.]|uniref:carboxypeptidase-like regulatory domain-containing protein n=1 Tax=Geoalkalibacter sp. TaxID=3041440 RepID=UPI00272E16E9|nr:carboxypeptidase-like regulatory domain-containing protein [Geoalkalibacter sp.]